MKRFLSAGEGCVPSELKLLLMGCMAALLLLMEISRVRAQSDSTSTSNTVESSQALVVGDFIPDELWRLPLSVSDHLSGQTSIITLGEYMDRGLIIIDFWATWCSSCVNSLYDLAKVQAESGDEVFILPVTYEDATKAVTFLQKKKIDLPTVVENQSLKDFFPHRAIPHAVVIRHGRVAAITFPDELTADRVAHLIEGHDMMELFVKEDVLNPTIDFLMDRSPIAQGVVLPYTPGFPSFVGGRTYEQGQQYYITNHTIYQILQYLFGVQRVVIAHLPLGIQYGLKLNYDDTILMSNSDLHEWMTKNAISYVYTVGDTTSSSLEVRNRARDFFQLFLIQEYGLLAEVKPMELPVYLMEVQDEALVEQAISSGESRESIVFTPKIFSMKDRNLRSLIYLLRNNYDIIDETGINARLSMSHDGNIAELDGLRTMLEKYGIGIRGTFRTLDVIHVTSIRDKF